MKIEIELDDIIEVMYEDSGDQYDIELTKAEIVNAIVQSAMKKYIQDLYLSNTKDWSMKDAIDACVKEHSAEIIDKTINKVSEEVLKKRAIVSQMPKKSEINGINKEWESYFIELIDKAIAKRFK